MARPKRMGAYNALDDLLPGGAWGSPEGSPGGSGPGWDPFPDDSPGEAPAPQRRLEPVPGPSRRPRRLTRRRGGNALDDLLPGPRGVAGVDEPPPGPALPEGRRARPGRSRAGGRHLEVWNPLDALPSAPRLVPAALPDPVPAKARVSFRLPADLVETARDAVAHLGGTGDRTTLTALAERALRAELARLAVTHNDGRPFPARDP
jgi:hypothetical protein